MSAVDLSGNSVFQTVGELDGAQSLADVMVMKLRAVTYTAPLDIAGLRMWTDTDYFIRMKDGSNPSTTKDGTALYLIPRSQRAGG